MAAGKRWVSQYSIHSTRLYDPCTLLINTDKISFFVCLFSLSEDMLSSIIQGIASYFIPARPKKALSFMKQLAKVNRFGTSTCTYYLCRLFFLTVCTCGCKLIFLCQHFFRLIFFPPSGTNLMFLSDSDTRVLTTIFVSLSKSKCNQETLKSVRKEYKV